MRVTSKGQVTIPKPIRDKLGIEPGAEVEFVSRKSQVFLERKTKAGAADDPAEALMRHIERNVGRFEIDGLQADDVMKLLRD